MCSIKGKQGGSRKLKVRCPFKQSQRKDRQTGHQAVAPGSQQSLLFSKLSFLITAPSTCDVHEDCFLPHSEVLLRASVPSPSPQVCVPMMGIRGVTGPCHLILTSSHSGTGGSTVFNPLSHLHLSAWCCRTAAGSGRHLSPWTMSWSSRQHVLSLPYIPGRSRVWPLHGVLWEASGHMCRALPWFNHWAWATRKRKRRGLHGYPRRTGLLDETEMGISSQDFCLVWFEKQSQSKTWWNLRMDIVHHGKIILEMHLLTQKDMGSKEENV